MIHVRWMNELELGRLFRTPPDLMLGVRKKLELDSILNLAERMGETWPDTILCDGNRFEKRNGGT